LVDCQSELRAFRISVSSPICASALGGPSPRTGRGASRAVIFAALEIWLLTGQHRVVRCPVLVSKRERECAGLRVSST
jgi:hypothetical protein